MVVGGTSARGVPFDVTVLTVVLVALVAVGSRLYPRLGQ
jgi:hypothetical protein